MIIKRNISIVCAVYFFISMLFFLFLTKYGAEIKSIDAYTTLARNMLEKRFFSSDGITAHYHFTPGYPLLIMIVYFLGGNDVVILFIQIICMTLRIWLSYNILVLLHVKERLALLGAVLMMGYLHQYRCAALIMTEPLFGLLLTAALYLLIRYLYYGKKTGYFAGFAVALNYAMFTRSILVYFNMLLTIALFVFFIRKKIRFRCFAAFFLCFMLVWGGWSYRNYRHSSVFIYTTIQGRGYSYDYPYLIKDWYKIPKVLPARKAEQEHQRFLQDNPQIEEDKLNAAQVYILARSYAINFIMKHFLQFILANITGLLLLLFNGFTFTSINMENIPPLLRLAMKAINTGYIIYSCLIYILYIAGLIKNKKNSVTISILLLTIYLIVPSAIWGSPRYRDLFFSFIVLSAIYNSQAIIQSIVNKTKSPLVKQTGQYFL